MHCSIRVQDHLDATWSRRLAGLQIIHETGGTSLLVGTLADQAALHGVLLRLINLGLSLRSLEIGTRPQESAPGFGGRASDD